MIADVTIITPAVEPRFARFLPEALESVRAQTVTPVAHLVGVDYARRGNAAVQNELAAQVNTEWIVLLADDDILYPTHLERCLAAAGDADVVYPYADMCEWPQESAQRRTINAPWDPERIRRENWIPGGCALIRTAAWRRVGGCNEAPGNFFCHDWLMWRDIAATGGKFICLPEQLWRYRYHGAQLEMARGKDREQVLRRAEQ